MTRPLTAALLVVLLAPAAARAAGEDEWQLSARLGIGDLHIDDRSPFGPVAAVEVERGFTDAWALRLMLSESAHSVDARMADHAPGGWARVSSLLAGVTYTFDVLRLVPYAQLGAGFVRFDGAVKQPRMELAGELGLGADYWLTKRWAVGGVLQYLFTPVDLFEHLGELGQSPFAFSLSVRASRLF
ncbi:MAG TPA: outer membrane beta-barrel protein [Polyangia bacterium]